MTPEQRALKPRKDSKMITGEKTLYCVSYMDGQQRVIAFTVNKDEKEMFTHKEASNMEVFVELSGIHVSVINNVNLEIALISITGSKPTWQMEANEKINVILTFPNLKGKYLNKILLLFKLFSNEYSEWLERKYCEYKLQLNEDCRFQDIIQQNESIRLLSKKNESTANHTTSNQLKFDFKEMKFSATDDKSIPESGKLVRNFEPGLKVQYRTSTNLLSLKFRIQNLQVLIYKLLDLT